MIYGVHNTVPEERDRNEEALVAGLTAGVQTQVENFLHSAHRPVYAMTARLTTDPDLRHDWSQDILLKILKEMASGRFIYQRPGCFWAWFKTRTNFLLINHYHQHKTHTERWTTGETGAAIVEKLSVPTGTNPQRMMEAVEIRRIVEECLEELSSVDQHHALHRLLFQELSYQEIADSMDTTLNTVRSWIRRARISMRQCVAGKMEYPSEENS